MRDCKHGQLARSCNICELEAERDSLADHLQKMQVTNGSLTDHVDRLKAEVEKWQGNFQMGHDQCLKWKAKAEKMAGALRRIANREYSDGIRNSVSEAKAALEEYEK